MAAAADGPQSRIMHAERLAPACSMQASDCVGGGQLRPYRSGKQFTVVQASSLSGAICALASQTTGLCKKEEGGQLTKIGQGALELLA